MDLVCPAGNLPSLKAAVDNGANAVYFGFKDDTNARHFAGLNFGPAKIAEGIRYARQRGVKVFLALNTYPQPSGWSRWQNAVDQAADLGVDAMIAADIGVLDYASNQYPDLNLHLSVQGSATNYEALRFYRERFGIRRAVLPRVLSLPQVEHVVNNTPVEIEVFGFGSLCVMVEGRCILSSYATGLSPNTFGACSPASHVEWRETEEGLQTRLGGVLIETYRAGRERRLSHAVQRQFLRRRQYFSCNRGADQSQYPGTAAGAAESRRLRDQDRRTPAQSGLRCPGDQSLAGSTGRLPTGIPRTTGPRPQWMAELGKVSEGTQTTLGAYSRPWQ